MGVERDVLWGRGAVDAKGPRCAMAAAAVETGVSFAGSSPSNAPRVIGLVGPA
jgi:hypothetical protein